jgi:DNA-binding XRE family transcriptional regulator
MPTHPFEEVRAQARARDPEHDAKVAVIRQAMEDAEKLAELRQHAGVTQVQLAERLGVTQGSVSELEHRRDLYVSTLRSYVEALGGHLEIAAVFDNGHTLLNV